MRVATAGLVDFEQFTVDGVPYVLGAEDSYHGYDSVPTPTNELPEEHPFTCNGVEMYNNYGEYTGDYGPWSSWDGWAVSNMTDTTTTGFGNMYSAITGAGVCGSDNYAVAYLPDNSWWGNPPENEVFRRAPIEVAHTMAPSRSGVYITNTTYAYLSMSGGDQFGYAYSSECNDYLCLSITGLDDQGVAIAGLDVVDFYLADFRQNRDPSDVQGDYIIDRWTWVDLSSLVAGGAEGLQFVFSSSDVGDYGINTPVYFAMDNIPSIPGDASLDGKVDADDAKILATHWGAAAGAEWITGDFNYDGAVDAADVSIMAANWGRGETVGEGAAVPEPSLLVLLLAAGVLLMAKRRRD